MAPPRRRRLVWLLLLLLLAWPAGLALWIGQRATVHSDARADCAIVLGAAVHGGAPSPVFTERLRHALTLSQQGRVAQVFVTGGVGEGETRSEGEVGAAWLRARGVAAVAFEGRSRSTWENLLEARDAMVARGWRSALLVSDPLHLPRATAMARHLGMQVGPAPTPTSRYQSWASQLPFLLREVWYWHTFHARQGLRRAPVAAGQEVVRWQPRWRGIDLARIHADRPRPLRMVAARIALDAPGVRLQLSPGAASERDRRLLGGRPPQPEARSQTTAAWLAQAGCQLAFNGSAYRDVVDEPGRPQDVAGLWKVGGVVLSLAEPRFDLWAFDDDNRVAFLPALATATRWPNVLPGFEYVLVDGATANRNPDIHPRTAVGVSADGRTLIVLVIDGRQPGVSVGVTLRELAGWIRRLGAWQALNLDGGGSTTLVAASPGGPEVLNTPIHRRRPGTLRPNANHVCVFAQPLPGAATPVDSR